MFARLVSTILAVFLLLPASSIALADNNIIEIEFYQQNEADVDIFERIIQVFESDYPAIHVKQVNLPEEDSGTVLNARIQNNDAPDVFNEWFSQDMFNKADAGVLRDMTDSYVAKLILPTVLSDTTYAGKNYMLPMTCNFMGVYYNADLFEKYSLKIPTTLDEFWALCDTLQALGITPISAGDKDGWNLAHWVQDIIGEYMPDYSDEFLDIYEGTLNVADMNGIADVAEIVINRSKYVQSDCLGADSETMVGQFLNQKAAMMLNGSWWMGTLNAAEPGFEYAVFPFPGRTKDETAVMSSADFSFVLSAQSSPEEQTAAETFVTWMMTTGAKIYISQSGAPSALQAIQADSSKYQAMIPYMKAGKVFRMPYSGRWNDAAYLDYTVALQNLVATGDIEAFYEGFEDALIYSGKPAKYVD